MKKDIFGIIGVVLSVVGFSIYYYYALFHYPNFSDEIAALSYIPIMVGLSLCLLQLTINSETIAKFIVYGSGAVLWSSIALSYIFKDIFHMISTKLFIISTAILCTIFGLILYAYRSYRR